MEIILGIILTLTLLGVFYLFYVVFKQQNETINKLSELAARETQFELKGTEIAKELPEEETEEDVIPFDDMTPHQRADILKNEENEEEI